jgi:hypothetical protein
LEYGAVSENHSNQSGTSQRPVLETVFLFTVSLWSIVKIADLAKTIRLFGDRGETWLLGASVLSFVGSLLWGVVTLLSTRGSNKLGRFFGGFTLFGLPLAMPISAIVAEYIIHSDDISLLCGHFGDIILVGYFTLIAADIYWKRQHGRGLFALRR